jgi:hypothetical protein
LYEKTNHKCQLTGIPFDFIKTNKEFKYFPTSVSLDKIDSSKGYTENNIRFIITAMNLALNQYGTEFFENMICNYIIHNQDKKVFENY